MNIIQDTRGRKTATDAGFTIDESLVVYRVHSRRNAGRAKWVTTVPMTKDEAMRRADEFERMGRTVMVVEAITLGATVDSN